MICPECGNDDLIITEAYDKDLDYTVKFKALIIAIFAIGLIVSLALFAVNATAGVVAIIIFGIIFCAYLNYKIYLRRKARRKSHSKCICKNCGYTWYLD